MLRSRSLFSKICLIHDRPDNSMLSQPSPAAFNSITPHPSSKATMSANQSSAFSGCHDNSRAIFPGLIPGLAGGIPGSESSFIHTSKQLLAPPAAPAASIHKSTDERVDGLEALVAEMIQEITSLRWINASYRQETDRLHARVAELEAFVAKCPPSIRQSPVSMIDSPIASRLTHPVREIPVQQRKRSRFAAFFDQMAVKSAAKTITQEKEMTVAPVFEQRYSTSTFARTPGASVSTLVASQAKETQVTSTHQEDCLSTHTAALFDALFLGLPIPNEEKATGGLLTPTSIDCMNACRADISVHEAPVQKVPCTSRFRAFFEEMALKSTTDTSTCADSHGKKSQACGAVHAPRPIRPAAPLLSRTDL
jgi:hypothetical protein